jgi:SAM-dependent methyltransferase
MTLPAGQWSQPVTRRQEDPNLHVYNMPEVAEHYASLDYLSPCEKALFDAFLKQGDAILDLGVGGGRTTPYLSSLASSYVGVDYASKMVVACQQKFPRLKFLVADAANLAPFDNRTFDSVVMAFNGMDYLIPSESRRQCLAEVHRVLRKDGVLIFSSHNPRAIFSRPAWSRKKVEELAQRLTERRRWLFEPARFLLVWMRIAAALVRSGMESALRIIRRLPRRAFWSGDGYMVDPAHGGLLTHYAVPKKVIVELRQYGFRLLRFTGDDYPRRSREYVTDWYYYVFQKNEASANAPCA